MWVNKMNDELKKKLEQAFDTGELNSLSSATRTEVSSDAEATTFLATLTAIEQTVQSEPLVSVPSGFTRAVMALLPRIKARRERTSRLQVVLLPVYLLVLAVVVIVFSDFFGITFLFETLSSQSEAIGEASLELIFIVVSSAGILLSAWLIISSLFGMRSRGHSY